MSKRIPLALALLLLALLGACRPANTLPTRSSPQYNEIVRTFYIGLAALQVGHDVQADAKLQQLTQLAPMEPAGWANWGLLALRQRNYDTAADRLNKARGLAPDNSDIFYLLGLLESSRGNTTQAITDLRKSVELDQNNLIAIYKLAEEVERQGDDKGAEEFQQLVQKILTAQPENLAALVELSRIAAKRGDGETAKATVAKISARSSSWPDEVRQQVTAVEKAVNSGDLRAAATQTTFLRNVLVRLPDYRRNLAAIKPPPGEEAVPFTHFLKMEAPVFKTAAPDLSITFNPEPLNLTADHADWIGAIPLSGSGGPVITTASAREVRLASGATLPFPGGAANTPPSMQAILPVDFSYDFKTDLVLAGDGGVRLFRQDSPSAFTDVTGETKLPATVVNASYTAAWAADIEADGDLDVILGSETGVPTVLRNNGDGTFLDIHSFSDVNGLVDFAWADLDGDGDADAVLIDGSNKLFVFSNERQGQFTNRSVPIGSPIRAISVLDLNSDGILDVAVVQNDGRIMRLSDKDHGAGWDSAEIVNANATLGASVLRVADLDNNGGLDLLLMPAARIWLNNGDGNFTELNKTSSPERVFDVADVTNDGRLDLLALSKENQPLEGINQSTKNYHWQIVRPRASNAVGDQRINPFGVGGEMEIRSGLLVQKQPITGPLLHFGLGEQTSADVIRVVWPNGTVRAEFEVKADQEVLTEQRLKASCPWLFAYNGKEMEFIKDAVPWGSAIGLRINTLGSAKIAATGEWYKIRRDQLVPHDGYYDIRVTAELWEVYYYDYIGLMPVDHPEGTEIFVDERFVVPPAKLGFTTVATPKPIKQAIDDNGNDVTSLLSARDGKALDNFGRGQFQGLTRDHFVEVDLGDDAPATGPLYLIAHGSIHDTESSVNVAITQGNRWRAKPMSVEVPDGNGGWRVAQENLGFPAGRKKTVLFNLTDLFKPGIPHRVRIRTNLEIYWDHLEWAVGLPDAPVKMVRLAPSSVDLHYRGYSVVNGPEFGAAPEVPDYYRLFSTKQAWRDLEGYYTRFGEVSELLQAIDDRYVIVASGDEMSFRFPELPPPAAGFVRDFILMGDGWIKDGDYNSTFSKTVQPLPHHAQNEYETKPGKLEDEVVYKRFPEDWQKYHTRYVAPDVFRNVLRTIRNHP
ncbi:MAG TPA: FG-GAP-like repeat-containing protein [Pyrinomonadaceae bacterium]|nr:FG-GAP-like repeat-containing protein [Pyrinomonadaceae bacterium]